MRKEIKSVIESSSHNGYICQLSTEIIARKYNVSVKSVRDCATKELKLKISEETIRTHERPKDYAPKKNYYPSVEVRERSAFASQIERLLR